MNNNALTPADSDFDHAQPRQLLLQGARVMDPATNSQSVADVLIENGYIKAIDHQIPTHNIESVLPLSTDHWVCPALVDLRTHGKALDQLTEAALKGGYGTICLTPETKPIPDNLANWVYLQSRLENLPIQVIPFAAMTEGLNSKALSEMKRFVAQGCLGFSNGSVPIMNANLMRLALRYSQDLDIPLIVHPQDLDLTASGCMHEGFESTVLGLPGIPAVAETAIIARDIELLRQNGGWIHFSRVSTAESVELIRRGKEAGLKITADVTIHHLALTDAEVRTYSTDYKVLPPLRSDHHRQALIQGLQDGTLDAIVSDHTPYIPDEKALSFDGAPYGTQGLETTLAAALSFLVDGTGLSPLLVLEKLTTTPAKLIQQPEKTSGIGQIKVGQPARLTIINPSNPWTVQPNHFSGAAQNSVFKGKSLRGTVESLVLGTCLYTPKTALKTAPQAAFMV